MNDAMIEIVADVMCIKHSDRIDEYESYGDES